MVLPIVFTEAPLPSPMHMVVGRLRERERERALRFVMAEWKEEQGNGQQKEKRFANHGRVENWFCPPRHYQRTFCCCCMWLVNTQGKQDKKKRSDSVTAEWKGTKKSAERGV